MSLDEFLIHLFIRDADNKMAKMAKEILERDKPNIHMIVNKIKETEVANMRPPKYCKPCDSRTHNESECWGECKNCGQRNHQSKHCRYKMVQQQQQANPQRERADKVATKEKKKRNRRAGKKATVNQSEEEEEAFKEELPRKADPPENRYEKVR